jgi:aminopeptidase N
MPDMSARMRAGSWDKVIAHEAGHQWFGDLITCKSWEHTWLNEGWASMTEALWKEYEASGERNKRRAYQRTIAGFVAGQRATNRTYAPLFGGMVTKRFADPMGQFMSPNDVYAKGAIVLHMLRAQLGDEIFFKGVRLYVDRFKFKEVETDDFRYCLEEVSGRSLERFFQQWCYRPGLARLSAEVSWQAASAADDSPALGGELVITVKQTQRIDADNPAYAFQLPIQIKTEAGEQVVVMDIDSRETVRRVPLAAAPEDVVIDPNMTIAAPTTVKKELAMWLRQLQDGHTGSVFAQLQAVEHLAAFAEPAAFAALAAAAIDSGQDELIRRTAAEGIAQHARRVVNTLLFSASHLGN